MGALSSVPRVSRLERYRCICMLKLATGLYECVLYVTYMYIPKIQRLLT